MKKQLLLVLFLIFGLATANAQVTVKPGVKAGVNFSNLSNLDTKGRTDFYAGGFVDINFGSFYTLQPEVVYSRQGAEVRNFYDDINLPNPNDPAFRARSFDLELQYVSFGVMNKFKIKEGFHALVGPSIDVKVGDNWENNEDLIDFDLAILGGLGYTFPSGLTIEARYKQGLVDIFGDDYTYYYDDDDYYYNDRNDVKLNQVFQVGISYTF